MNMLSGGKKFCLNKKAKHQEKKDQSNYRIREVQCITMAAFGNFVQKVFETNLNLGTKE